MPRSHFQLVGLPVDASVKFTISGEHPEREGAALKSAVSWPDATAWQHRKKMIANNRQRFLTTTVIGLDVCSFVGYLLAKILAAIDPRQI